MYCDEFNSLFLMFPRKIMPGMPAQSACFENIFISCQ